MVEVDDTQDMRSFGDVRSFGAKSRVIEVPVEELSEEYYTVNMDGTVVEGKDQKKEGRSEKKEGKEEKKEE